MKRTMKFAMAALSLSLLTGMAYAAKPGAYIGLGVGPSRVDTPDNSLFSGADNQTFKVGGLGGRVFAGYNFNEYLGLETGYAKYAQSKYTARYNGFSSPADIKVTADGSAFDLIAKAYLPLGQSNFNLYALAGLARMEETVTGKGHSIDESVTYRASANAVRPKYGVGISYDTSSNVSAAIEFSRVDGKDLRDNGINNMDNLDMLSLNISYNFG